jgi:hypothetical protein
MTRLALLLLVAVGCAAPAAPHDDTADFEWVCTMAQMEYRPRVRRCVGADSSYIELTPPARQVSR